MSKQKIKYALFAAVLLALAVWGTCNLAGKLPPAAASTPTVHNLTIFAAAGPQKFTIEIARTHAEQERGLMYRDHMAADHGMLFPYAEPQEVSFWMHETRIPLDLVFIDAGGHISRIAADARPYDETPIPSHGDISAVLEINGGEAARRGIKVGDRVD